MRDFRRLAYDHLLIPAIASDQTDQDFAVYISLHPVDPNNIFKLLTARQDGRLIIWTPAELTTEERDRLIDFAAYRKLVADWQGKETEDAVAVIHWVANALQTELARIVKIVDNSYARGRIDALNNSQMDFRVAGELATILTPLVDRVLNAIYVSRDIKFDPPFIFRKEEGVKVINGIVKTGHIPRGAKPNQNISAAQNFGFSLNIMKKRAEKELDVSDNVYVRDLGNFINDRLIDEHQTMKVETLYKNFMGIGGPQNYGLSRRMVQIYLLCLVREGKVRVTVNARAGIPQTILDYSNIAEVDFSTKILDALAEVHKVAKPENWEVLLPFAEKLLATEIPATQDDAVISEYRRRLRELFIGEKEQSQRMLDHCHSLFDLLKTDNPYATELSQLANLFATDIDIGNDIQIILHALQQSLGYQAFASNHADPLEVDDLANRLKNYRDLQSFLRYETEIRTAAAYCALALTEAREFAHARQEIETVRARLGRLKDYIDSDVRLKTELIGHAGESGTILNMIHEYASVYLPLHESIINTVADCRSKIDNLLSGRDLAGLKILEGISALQPGNASKVAESLNRLQQPLFACPTPTRNSVEDQLRQHPQHVCGLTFANAPDRVQSASEAVTRAGELVHQTLHRKLEVFLNPAVRQRLEQGQDEPMIAALLACPDTTGLQNFLVTTVLENPGLVELINRYLKRIVVKRVRLADFKPSINTIEPDQVDQVVQEFTDFLKNQLEQIQGQDVDSLPMLQLETED